MKKSQIIKIMVCFLPLLLLFLPAPAGMNPKAWELFPFYAGAILGIMLHPFSEVRPRFSSSSSGFTPSR